MIKITEAANGFVIEANRPGAKPTVFTSKLKLLLYLDDNLSGRKELDGKAKKD